MCKHLNRYKVTILWQVRMDSLDIGMEVFGFGVWVLIGWLANTLNWPANWNVCLGVKHFCAGLPVFSGVSVVAVLLLLCNPL